MSEGLACHLADSAFSWSRTKAPWLSMLAVIIRDARGAIAGYAANLNQAMRLADEPDFSLAVLDFRLGPDTSLPLAAKLHAAGIPFIFHTGCGISELEKAYPYAPIVEKPAAAEDLIASLVDVLSAPSAKMAAR
jgi:hypothetical protein